MSEAQQDVQEIQAPLPAEAEVHVSETTVGMVDTALTPSLAGSDPKTESSDTVVVDEPDNQETATGSGKPKMGPAEAANVLMDINRGKATVYSSDERKHIWY